uniref:Uncharacterized protein n=1 Tax=Ditylenchus dipsaci TaxID=166011 RepID=A0A915ETM7_9BILA
MQFVALVLGSEPRKNRSSNRYYDQDPSDDAYDQDLVVSDELVKLCNFFNGFDCVVNSCLYPSTTRPRILLIASLARVSNKDFWLSMNGFCLLNYWRPLA